MFHTRFKISFVVVLGFTMLAGCSGSGTKESSAKDSAITSAEGAEAAVAASPATACTLGSYNLIDATKFGDDFKAVFNPCVGQDSRYSVLYTIEELECIIKEFKEEGATHARVYIGLKESDVVEKGEKKKWKQVFPLFKSAKDDGSSNIKDIPNDKYYDNGVMCPPNRCPQAEF